MTLLQAHRGVSAEAPENTMPAFALAVKQGYKAIETDPLVTKDGVVVLHHDDDIGRTARNADGTEIENPPVVEESTYEQLLAYDFGIWKHPKYAGTKIPLLTEAIELAQKGGVTLKLDAKILKLPEAQRDLILNLAAQYPEVCHMSTKTVEQTLWLHEKYPQMHLHFGGACEKAALEELKVIPKAQLYLWMPYPNLRTAYAYAHLQGLKPGILQVPPITLDRVVMARKYGHVCVWNLQDEAEYLKVQTMGVEIAETNGEVKPAMNRGVVADMHNHCDHSHDSKCPMEDIYNAQREKGVAIMAIADHYDGFFLKDGPYSYQHILDSVAEADVLSAKYPDGRILRGIELGEGHWHPEETKKVLASTNFDVVVGAAHAIRSPLMEGATGMKRAFSQLKYNELTAEQTYELMKVYYEENLEMVRTADIDICAHLTCAVGYFLSRHGIFVGVEQFKPQIREILQTIIDRGIALEVNFSGYPATGVMVPHRWILEMYREMGGYMVCMATDSHSAGRVAVGKDEGLAILKEMGFKHLFYFENRMPVQCTIE